MIHEHEDDDGDDGMQVKIEKPFKTWVFLLKIISLHSTRIFLMM